MRKTIACLATLLALAGCMEPAPPTRIDALRLGPAHVAAVQAGVRAALKDPGSAQFGPMGAARGDGVVRVCGLVNAKNSFGGYTGMVPFAGILENGNRFSVSGGLTADTYVVVAVRQACRRNGIGI